MFIDERETNFTLCNEVPMYQTADKKQFNSLQKAEKYALDQVCSSIEKKIKSAVDGSISSMEIYKIILALVGTAADIEELFSIINYWKLN